MLASRSAPAILLALALIFTGGCGDSDDPEPQTTAAQEDAPQAPSEGEGSQAQPQEAEQPAQPADRDAEPERRADDEAAAYERPLTVAEVTEVVLTGAAPPERICEELVTPRFLRTAYGSRQGCVAAVAPGAGAKSVSVDQVEENGAAASAVAVPRGGPYDGIELEVTLAADDSVAGAWVLDELVADIPAGP